jgi:hypothetical protein
MAAEHAGRMAEKRIGPMIQATVERKGGGVALAAIRASGGGVPWF